MVKASLVNCVPWSGSCPYISETLRRRFGGPDDIEGVGRQREREQAAREKRAPQRHRYAGLDVKRAHAAVTRVVSTTLRI